jgi:hypothetical protein
MMRKLMLWLLAGWGLAAGMALAGPLTLYSIERDGPRLHAIDPASGATLSTVTITLAGHTVFHGNGLARHPLTNELYALVELGFRDRRLVTLDPDTGVATLIGATGGLAWAGITFAQDGTLYGVTGQGSPNPETLFTLDPDTGTPTLVVALGNGNDGEAIAYNPADNLIYHASGNLGDPIFETVHRTTFAITDIAESGDQHSEITALVHAGAGLFHIGDNALTDNASTPRFFTLTDGGVSEFVGFMDHVSKGFAFFESAEAPLPGTLVLLCLGLAAAALARRGSPASGVPPTVSGVG